MASYSLAYLLHGETLHVLGAPADALSRMRPLGVFAPDWAAVHSAGKRVRAQMHHAADSGELSAAALEEVRRLCGFLFDELVPLEAKRWLRDGGGSLSLSLPSELAGLPWELLHTGAAFLCLQWSVGRVVQLADEPEPGRAIEGGTRKLLIVADPDGSLDDAYDEGVALQSDLREAENVSLSFRASDVDAAFVRRHARDFDIVHYAGHIDPDGWRMSESRFDRDAIARLTGGAALPALVFANGCAGANDHADDSMLDAWLEGGVRHLIGPLFDVPDRLGHLFARAFYQHLIAGRTIGDSVRAARVALAADLGEGTVPWGAYVLYGDPDAVYFPARASVRVPLQPKRPAATRLRPTERPGAEAVRSSTAALTHANRQHTNATPVFALIVLFIVLLAVASVALINRVPSYEGFTPVGQSARP